MNNQQNNINEKQTPAVEKLATIPTSPGIYQFKNENKKIIYIGKAKNLRNRVRSYFQQNRPVDAKTKALMLKIYDIEFITVDSEAEALILEDTLIKKYKPKYNIMLRDDKSYPFVRITNEPFPRVFITRKVIKDGSIYFGPFTEVGRLRYLMRTIRNLFQFRSCKLNITQDSIDKKKFKICLDFHIKKCEGPCEGYISQIKYNENVQQAIAILNGKTKDIEKTFEEQMLVLSEELRFEEAATIRNRYLNLKEYLSHQKIVSADLIDRDVIGICRLGDEACTLVLKIREGKLIGKRHFIIQNCSEQPEEQLIQSTIEKWYLESEFVPKEIFLPFECEQPEFILDWLKQKRGKSLDMIVPKLGEKKKFVTMASTNAEFQLREWQLSLMKREQTVTRPVMALQRDLRLSKTPLRIECFDNSHIQGSELVSSCVVFENGKPKKSDYRKFKIETVHQNDDFAAMREVIGRRYKRILEEQNNENPTPLPDLIIIDGGKGQLSSAMEIIIELGLLNKVIVIGLAKRIEEVFFPNQKDSILLPKTSSSLRLIQHLRDEAHRFAITFHRKLRDKRTIQTELTSIEGIGEKTSQKLLIHFGSVENIRNASLVELLQIINEKSALKIIEHFKNNIK